MSFQQVTTYIKDYSAVLFALTGTVLAVMTYLRARETILQPVRSEVIKKQTELLISILSLVGHGINEKADYMGMIRANILQSMLDCGATFKDEDKLKKLLKDEVKGAVFDEEGAHLFELAPVFETKSKNMKRDDLGRRFYEDAKKGKYKMPVLNLTGKNLSFANELEVFINDPFVPRKIKQQLERLDEDIQSNITIHLAKAVEDAINASFARGGTDVPSVAGVYNTFHRSAVSHDVTVEDLRREIRAYLKIDSMP